MKTNLLKAAVVAIGVMMCGSAWADTYATSTVRPSAERYYRVDSYSTPSFKSGYPTDTKDGTTQTEITSQNSNTNPMVGMFVLQQFDLSEINTTSTDISSLTITYYGASGKLGIWLYDSKNTTESEAIKEESNWTATATEKAATIIPNVTNTMGVRFDGTTDGTTAGTITAPLGYAEASSSKFTYTLTGTALTNLLTYASKHSGKVNILIAAVKYDATNTKYVFEAAQSKIYGKNVTARASQPQLTVTYNYKPVYNQTTSTSYDDLQSALGTSTSPVASDDDVIILKGDINVPSNSRFNLFNSVKIKDDGYRVNIYRSTGKANMFFLPNTASKKIEFEGTEQGKLVFDGVTGPSDVTATCFEISKGSGTFSLKNVTIQNITTTKNGAVFFINSTTDKVVLEDVIFDNIKSTDASAPCVIFNKANSVSGATAETATQGLVLKGAVEFKNIDASTNSIHNNGTEVLIAGTLTNENRIVVDFGTYTTANTFARGTIDANKFTIPSTQIANGFFVVAKESDNNLVLRNTTADALCSITADSKTTYYGSLQAAVDAAATGATINVLKNFNVYSTVYGEKELTISGAGKTITNKGGGMLLYNYTSACKVTLSGTAESPLVIAGNGSSTPATNYILAANNNGTITMNNVKIKDITSAIKQGIICNKGDGTLNMNGVTFDNCTNTGDFKALVFVGTDNCTLSGNNTATSCTADEMFYVEGTRALKAGTLSNTSAITIKYDTSKRSESSNSTLVKSCTDATKFKVIIKGYYLDSNGTNLVIKKGTIESRTTATDSYGTICLPYDFTATGATVMAFTGRPSTNELVFTTVDEPKAGVPYLYKATAASQTFACDMYSTKVETPTAVNNFTGVYTQTDMTAGNYFLSKTDNKFCKAVNASGENVTHVFIGAYKCYFTELPTVNSAKVGTITLGLVGDETTDINAINFNEVMDSTGSPIIDGKFIQNGKLVIMKNGKMFNAAGQQIK